MNVTAEQKQAVDRAGEQSVLFSGPETPTKNVIVREDVFRKLWQAIAIDHSDHSLYEVGEFRLYK